MTEQARTAPAELRDLRIAERRAAIPEITYPPALPVSQRREELLAAIRDHQVVIVAGETGSGKTTQLPKICLELGRGVQGMIGHTQPRRIAARSVAERIAEELRTQLGDVVGYQVRFTDRVSDRTAVKVMTDGILLTELQRDRRLSKYDTIIVDEAHERSLNIDFILGYLKRLLPRRPDLKLIVTSATIDPQRFSRHFDDAPIVEVSGRMYPVEIRYRPYGPGVDGASVDGANVDRVNVDRVSVDRASVDRASVGRPANPAAPSTDRRAGERDQIDAICDAVDELCQAGPGDILVFLSGEREIRDTAEALGKVSRIGTEILPLYARLSMAEQRRVFQRSRSRRIVLATNVAETSLTVPGIRYVIDPGTARISRYSHRLKVQRLPIEPISQASANQRAGRCGRVAAGICIRLYSELEFAARPEFTDPEILRTNLASVILQMTALGLGDVAGFGFIDPPDRRNVADGVRLLEELGAFRAGEADPRRRMTRLGRQLVRLPIDPRLARMVIEADRQGCLEDLIVLAAALSIVDPRERPVDRQQAADQAHARFTGPDSDFLAYLGLWRYLTDRQRELSSSQFRRLCGREFLNYLRVREWQDLHSQLRQVARGLGFSGTAAAPAEVDSRALHTCLLAGLLSHVGLRDPEKSEYLGARGARFGIFPGSGLFKKQPRWVVAAELVETSRLWARIVARVEPEWIEPLAGHLVKRTYSEPHWDPRQGAVLGFERVTLYGLPLVTRRSVNFGRIDPGLARELFIRNALVAGDWTTHHKFVQANRELLNSVEELERRTRRRDIVADDEVLFDFFDQRVPPEVVSARHFDAWWKLERQRQPDLLTYPREILINEGAGAVSPERYPDDWRVDGFRLPLTYRFEPGTPGDGVTVDVPLPALGQLPAEAFGWQVPGLREELVTALLRALPKALRRDLVPLPDCARSLVAQLKDGEGNLLAALERQIRQQTAVVVPREAWQLDRVPEHLKLTFRVVDDRNRPLAEGKNLAELRARFQAAARAALAEAAGGAERTGLRGWTVGTVPQRVEHRRDGLPLIGYPALVDESGSVALRILATPDEQRAAMWTGIRRLLLLTVPSPVKLVNAQLTNEAKLALSRNPHRSAADLLDDCLRCAVDRLMAEHGGLVWDEAGFTRLRQAVRAGLHPALLAVVGQVRQILALGFAVGQRLERLADQPASVAALAPAVNDLRSQLAGLIFPGFVTRTGWAHLPELPRYLRAIERRLDRLPGNPGWDAERLRVMDRVLREYAELTARTPAGGPAAEALADLRWMLEELRVGLFAQALGTAYPVSEQRVYRAMDDIEDRLTQGVTAG